MTDSIGMSVVGDFRYAEIEDTVVIDNRPKLDAEREQLALFPHVYECIRIPRQVFNQIARQTHLAI